MLHMFLVDAFCFISAEMGEDMVAIFEELCLNEGFSPCLPEEVR